jgi:hypothetical protein
MKTLRPNLTIAATTIALLLLSFAPAYSAAQHKKPVISKKELTVLLKTATEPADHQKIADYYRQEAARLTASSKEHAQLAEIYAKNPPFAGMESKHGAGFGQGASHCNKWAELQAEEAKEAEALAAMHEDMAKQAAQKQP